MTGTGPGRRRSRGGAWTWRPSGLRPRCLSRGRRDDRGETLAWRPSGLRPRCLSRGRQDDRGGAWTWRPSGLRPRCLSRGRRDDRGETLAFLVLWPALIVAILLLLVHAFIVTNARSEAEVAASAGLRAAWRSAANSDFHTEPDSSNAYTLPEPHPDVRAMAEAAQDAVARAAATEGGWRWWTPGVAEVQSDWCSTDIPAPGDPDVPGDRPTGNEAGWVRVVVSGEVYGPLAALWPDRLDRVYSVATGPAILVPPERTDEARPPLVVPADLPPC